LWFIVEAAAHAAIRWQEKLNGLQATRVSASIMIKITTTALVAATMLIASHAFAGDKACCVRGASNSETAACADLEALNLTPDQKTKIEAWQAECMKAGCTKESRKTFFKQAKGILSAEQFAQLKAACKKSAGAKKTET
jgi:hypothetical protein